MDARHALRLQVEWGADEALDPQPHSRMQRSVPQSAEPPPPSKAPAAPGLRPVIIPPEAADLAALVAALAASDGAGLAATATHLVPPAGPAGGLLVLGEAPGAAEDRDGAGFVGPEGLLLRRMLGSIGIDPAEALLAYLVPWRPPGGRAPNATELAACLPFARRLLTLARPSVLLLLGSGPARALLGATARRGRWAELGPETLGDEWPGARLPALPTGQPAVLLKQPQQKAAVWSELRMLRRKMDKVTCL